MCEMFEQFQKKGRKSLMMDFYSANSIPINYVNLISLMKGDAQYIEKLLLHIRNVLLFGQENKTNGQNQLSIDFVSRKGDKTLEKGLEDLEIPTNMADIAWKITSILRTSVPDFSVKSSIFWRRIFRSLKKSK